MDNHARNVRTLYKTCLKLHRGLPTHLRIIGDTYVRDEFKRHKTVQGELTNVFMEEWAKYAITLAKQLNLKTNKSQRLGEHFEATKLEQFSAEQVHQLYELYKETSKPS